MRPGLNDKVAIVTGAGRGIGAATAALLAEGGSRVVLASRSADELAATRRAIAEKVGADRVLGVPTDVADEDAVTHLFETTIERFGDIHILVNNAGQFAGRDFAEMDSATWDRIQAVNVRGAFLASREAFRRLRALRHGGAIVNVSSLGGVANTEKFAGFTAYTVSKFAIIGLTETLAVDGRSHGIRVNCVAPGAVETQMKRDAAPFLETTTMPEDIAKVIRFLCDDDESGVISGSVIAIHSNR